MDLILNSLGGEGVDFKFNPKEGVNCFLGREFQRHINNKVPEGTLQFPGENLENCSRELKMHDPSSADLSRASIVWEVLGTSFPVFLPADQQHDQ